MSEGDDIALSPEILLRAYAAGIFPMAESADDPGLHWIEPRMRGIIPLESFHLSTKMRRFLRANPYKVCVDQDFPAVIDACASPRKDGAGTWINSPIRALYTGLFALGHCHSVEVWDGSELVGGLYGVRLGAAFFGESMFHKQRDCSKLALIHLVARLKAGGFTLLDTQFVTEHLRQFGAIEVPRKAYKAILDKAIKKPADFTIWPKDTSPDPMRILEALAL